MSEHNIEVQGGSAVRLKTAGKYCDRDIVVFARGGSMHDVKLDYTDNNAVYIPDGLFRGAFTSNEGTVHPIASVKFRKAKEVGQEAFRGLSSLKSVTMPVVEKIGEEAFYGAGLAHVDFPYCTTVLMYAFSSCKNLDSVHLPSLENASAGAFSDCTALKEINLPKLDTLAIGVFTGCTALTDAAFEKADAVIDEAFYECRALANVHVPAAGTVGKKAFEKCTSLTQLDLPMVTSIGVDAFAGCTNLSAVILRTTATVCVADLSAFTGTPMMTGQGHIYVPSAMYQYYKAGYEAALDTLMPGFFHILFRKIEDYSVDGTVTGDLDETKI